MDRNLHATRALEAPALPAKPYAVRILDRISVSAAVAALVLTAVSFIGSMYWVFELLTHFRLQFVTGATVIALWAVVRRAPTTALIATIAVAANLVPLLPFVLPGTAAAQASELPVRIMVANVSFRNSDYSRVREAVSRENPDVVGLLEVNEVWLDELAVLGAEYPYTVFRPQEGAHGLALYSRFPVQELPTSPYIQDGVQTSISVDLQLRPARVHLILAHLMAPIGPREAALRNEQIARLATLMEEDSDVQQILIGDLNVTPWSPKYAPLETRVGLSNAARGRGYVPTWPSWMPTGFLRIPIDHCLVSEGLSVQQFRTGPDIGSDHLPIVVDVAPAVPAPAESI
jgi:endonuclease/exonuclease/phosphatase (EEP) superfamily protein YafD